MPNYVLSAHASTVISERGISTEWIERILESPQSIAADRTDAQIKHALGRIAEYGDRVLRVVYNDTTQPVNVVTAYFDRAMKDKL